MFGALFRNITESEKNDAIEAIVQHASPRPDFFLMLVLSIATAVFGILLDSMVILIGSMLIAPLLYPILSLSLGIVASDETLIKRSTYTIVKSVIIALATGSCIAIIFRGAAVPTLPIVTSPSLMYAMVAALAGFAAAFAVTKPHLNEALPGVAVAVTLVPPLAVVNVGVAHLDWTLISNAMLLFAVNIIGVMFSAMIVFSLMRFSTKKKVTQEAVKEETAVVKMETAPQQ